MHGSNHLLRILLVAICLGALPPDAVAAGKSHVSIVQAWARASIGTTRPAAAYVTLVNRGHRAVALTGVSSPAAGHAMVHKTIMKGGTMKMLPAGRLEIPAGKRLTMKPGGFHIMLMHLKHALKKGKKVNLTLRFSDGTKLKASAKIFGPGAQGPK